MQQYQQHQHLSIFSSNIRVVDKLRAGWIGMSKSPPKLQSSDIQSKFLGFVFFFQMQARICWRHPNSELPLLVPPICKEPRGTTVLILLGGYGFFLLGYSCISELRRWHEGMQGEGGLAPLKSLHWCHLLNDFDCRAHFLQKQDLMWYHLPLRLYISHTAWTLLKY